MCKGWGRGAQVVDRNGVALGLGEEMRRFDGEMRQFGGASDAAFPTCLVGVAASGVVASVREGARVGAESPVLGGYPRTAVHGFSHETDLHL